MRLFYSTSERERFRAFVREEEEDLFIPQQFVDCRVCFERTTLQCACCNIACCSRVCQDEIHPEFKELD